MPRTSQQAHPTSPSYETAGSSLEPRICCEHRDAVAVLVHGRPGRERASHTKRGDALLRAALFTAADQARER